jgi:hypothetical protein
MIMSPSLLADREMNGSDDEEVGDEFCSPSQTRISSGRSDNLHHHWGRIFFVFASVELLAHSSNFTTRPYMNSHAVFMESACYHQGSPTISLSFSLSSDIVRLLVPKEINHTE